MAELLKSKDDCVPDAVDWEEVKLSAFPENAATAARDGDCVFADCSTVHGPDSTACARCGGVTTPTCIRSFVKPAAAAAKFLPVASAAAWVCPPCLWAVGQGALMVLPRDVGSDTLSEAGTNPPDVGKVLGADHQDETVRAQAAVLRAQMASLMALNNSLRQRLDEQQLAVVPVNLDIRRAVCWGPYVATPSGCQQILAKLKERYGPFLEDPSETGSHSDQERRVIWQAMLALLVDGRWTESCLPAVHVLLVRLEALRLWSREATFLVGVAKASAYERTLAGVDWQAFDDEVVRRAKRAVADSDLVKEALRKERNKGAEKESRKRGAGKGAEYPRAKVAKK
ncbi:hypothetical protein DIPPA_01372 [Diplonema papillatum]|nr:hypothetical protein DIPPA_01372 [Diplonema papillatum]